MRRWQSPLGMPTTIFRSVGRLVARYRKALLRELPRPSDAIPKKLVNGFVRIEIESRWMSFCDGFVTALSTEARDRAKRDLCRHEVNPPLTLTNYLRTRGRPPTHSPPPSELVRKFPPPKQPSRSTAAAVSQMVLVAKEYERPIIAKPVLRHHEAGVSLKRDGVRRDEYA